MVNWMVNLICAYQREFFQTQKMKQLFLLILVFWQCFLGLTEERFQIMKYVFGPLFD